MRAAIFRGAVIEALDIKSYDTDMFLRWREDLLEGDTQLEQIVKDELTARVRRLDREGWHDLREVSPMAPQAAIWATTMTARCASRRWRSSSANTRWKTFPRKTWPGPRTFTPTMP